jgi:integrase
VPQIRVHDLRHFAATTMLSSEVPLAIASKTMRHSTLSTTTEVYGHTSPSRPSRHRHRALTAAENATHAA